MNRETGAYMHAERMHARTHVIVLFTGGHSQ